MSTLIKMKTKELALCSIPNCDLTLYAKGFCRCHYNKDRKKKIREGTYRPKWYDRNGCIAYLRILAVEVGEDLSLRQYEIYQKANGGPTNRTFFTIFGSWNSAKAAAGLKLNPQCNTKNDMKLNNPSFKVSRN